MEAFRPIGRVEARTARVAFSPMDGDSLAVANPLSAVTRRAGAVLATRDGQSCPTHYGSAAGELGVCVRTVGLADRCDLGKLWLTGSASGIRALVRAVTGVALEPQGVTVTGTTWWCAAAPDDVVVLCEAGRRAQLVAVLRAQARRFAGVDVADVSRSVAAIALVGPRTGAVLAALDAMGPGADPRAAVPFADMTAGGVAVRVLLQSDRRALLLTDPADADRLWHALAAAGRPHGLSCVGVEAVERFALFDRPRVPTAA
jgi:glycine cleavage system aminomethyltransferase T